MSDPQSMPPLPRSVTPLPQPLNYGQPQPNERWSSIAVTAACGFYGLLLTGFAFAMDKHLKPVFRDFKIELPITTQVMLTVSNWLVSYYLWIPMLLVLLVLPAVAIPMLPAPPRSESRRRIVKVTRSLILIIYLSTVVMLVLAMFQPMIALIESVSGPQKH